MAPLALPGHSTCCRAQVAALNRVAATSLARSGLLNRPVTGSADHSTTCIDTSCRKGDWSQLVRERCAQPDVRTLARHQHPAHRCSVKLVCLFGNNRALVLRCRGLGSGCVWDSVYRHGMPPEVSMMKRSVPYSCIGGFHLQESRVFQLECYEFRPCRQYFETSTHRMKQT